MVARRTTITRKGQITIPIDIRRGLSLNEGDQLTVEQQGETVLIRRAGSTAGRTAGALAAYRHATPLTTEIERTAFAQAVADEVAASSEA